MGFNRSGGPKLWKRQNQINEIDIKKKSQGNKLILKGMLCSWQNPLTQKRKDRWSFLVCDSWVIISVLFRDKNDTIFKSSDRRCRSSTVNQEKDWPFTVGKKNHFETMIIHCFFKMKPKSSYSNGPAHRILFCMYWI